MEKLKQKSFEIIEYDREYNSDPDYKEVREEREARKYDNLKPEINELLWSYLPEDITMKEAEVLSMAVMDLITNPLNYLKK